VVLPEPEPEPEPDAKPKPEPEPDAKPKPKGKAKAVDIEMKGEMFILVDAAGKQVGEQEFETIEAATEALG
jgi:hypothetical protein